MKHRILCAGVLACALFGIAANASGQQRKGEVAGFLSVNTLKYSGEFTDDFWGLGGTASLQYAPMRRLLLEARFGLGEIRWGISPADIERYPEYFGQGAQLGDNYPGTNTKIESENESRITSFDFLVHYVLVDNIAAVPFISAGIGLVNFSPSTSQQHEALPNKAAQVYSGSAFSMPVGGGVRIPFSQRVGLMLRGEYRFVFTGYLDDLYANGSNDGITSISVGLTYAFTPGVQRRHHHRHEPCYDCPERDMYDDRYGDDRYDDDRYDGDENLKYREEDYSIPDSVKSNGADTAKSRNADTTANTPTMSDTSKPKPEPHVAIQPCPPGMQRFCASENESVCAQQITPGTERIKWEDSFIVDAGDKNDRKTLRQADEQQPCYDAVVRQTANAYYMCVECCFEKVTVGGTVQYNTLGGSTVIKGPGPFKAEACPDCKTVVSQGR